MNRVLFVFVLLTAALLLTACDQPTAPMAETCTSEDCMKITTTSSQNQPRDVCPRCWKPTER